MLQCWGSRFTPALLPLGGLRQEWRILETVQQRWRFRFGGHREASSDRRAGRWGRDRWSNSKLHSVNRVVVILARLLSPADFGW